MEKEPNDLNGSGAVVFMGAKERQEKMMSTVVRSFS